MRALTGLPSFKSVTALAVAAAVVAVELSLRVQPEDGLLFVLAVPVALLALQAFAALAGLRHLAGSGESDRHPRRPLATRSPPASWTCCG